MKSEKYRTNYGRVHVAVNVVILSVVVYFLYVRDWSRNTYGGSTPITGSEAEKRILNSAVKTRVASNFCPVVIYSVENGRTNFSQCGVIYTNYTKGSGSVRLLSTAHLFFKRTNEVSFVVRSISPVSDSPEWCISKILRIGSDWETWLDLAECEISQIAEPLPIVPCDFSLEVSELKLYTFQQIGGAALIPRGAITSLVTGENFELKGIALETSRDSVYFLIDRPTDPGDSSTPFLGKDGELYFMGKNTLAISQSGRDAFKLVSHTPGLVIGPIKILR